MIWEHVDDICAGVVIIGCFIAILVTGEKEAWGLLGAAAAWCFHSAATARGNGKSK